MTNGSAGRLYVVATPIGNLEDFSPRARATLARCALIAAEDTRHTGALLRHFGIETPLISLHDHNEQRRTPELIARLKQGAHVALVSDAGTPGISDPGFDLVRAAAAVNIEVVAIPGACALVAALSIAGLPTDRFCFEGFLPARAAARRARLKALKEEARTLVFYESPHRVQGTLDDVAESFGASRGASVAREITKLHETLYRGSLGELARRAREEPDFTRGEIVIVVAGATLRDDGEGNPESREAILDRALRVLLPELPLKQAAHLAARIADARDNEAYKRALKLRQSGEPGEV